MTLDEIMALGILVCGFMALLMMLGCACEWRRFRRFWRWLMRHAEWQRLERTWMRYMP